MQGIFRYAVFGRAMQVFSKTQQRRDAELASEVFTTKIRAEWNRERILVFGSTCGADGNQSSFSFVTLLSPTVRSAFRTKCGFLSLFYDEHANARKN